MEIKIRTVGSAHICNAKRALKIKVYGKHVSSNLPANSVCGKIPTGGIDKSWRSKLFAIIGNLINEANCKTIIVNGVEDHVHCMVGLKPVVSVSELMKTVKAKSSKYINDHSLTEKRFEWQEGYGVFSYGQSQVDSVYKYIQNQDVHHKKQTFREEYLEFLNSFKIAYDYNMYFMNFCKYLPILWISFWRLPVCNGLKSVVTKYFEPTALFNEGLREGLGV